MTPLVLLAVALIAIGGGLVYGGILIWALVTVGGIRADASLAPVGRAAALILAGAAMAYAGTVLWAMT